MFCKKDLLLQNLKHLYKEAEMFSIDIDMIVAIVY